MVTYFIRPPQATESIFTPKPLDSLLIGDGLGLMKDEMNGLLIKEAYFISNK